MTLPGAARDHAAERRRRAEEIAREQTARSPEGFAAPPSEDPRRTLHELRVHQIELELQNEELRWAQGELEQLVAARTEELRRANEELRADIAERRRAEAALRLSERRYRDVVENLHEGLWLIDSQNRTTFANPYLAKMLGYTPEDMLGQSLFAFLNGVEESSRWRGSQP